MKYYLLRITALESSFSITEAGRTVKYKYDSAFSHEIFENVEAGDIVIGYSVRDNKAHYVFNVLSVEDESSLMMYKSAEVAEGAALSNDITDEITHSELVEISKEDYEKIYANLFKALNTVQIDNKNPEKEKKTLPKRSQRTVKIHPLNCILYGAPGTGKTYATPEYALAVINDTNVDTSEKTEKQRLDVMEKYNKLIQEERIVFTTFHQNYGYEDFIQGLRPDTSQSGISFVNVDGVLKKIADKAIEDQANNYVIIIDEINRANISKVFGELITLIEEDKRWGELNQTSVSLPSGELFAVPNNLYIIGTMNSSDKSISLIDAALRRRFDFIEQRPNENLIKDDEVRKIFNLLNTKLVSELDSTDLLIGHSYFIGKKIEDMDIVFNNKIIPLLYEYFYDNRKKVASILTDVLKDTQIEVIDEKYGRLSVKKN